MIVVVMVMIVIVVMIVVMVIVRGMRMMVMVMGMIFGPCGLVARTHQTPPGDAGLLPASSHKRYDFTPIA